MSDLLNRLLAWRNADQTNTPMNMSQGRSLASEAIPTGILPATQPSQQPQAAQPMMDPLTGLGLTQWGQTGTTPAFPGLVKQYNQEFKDQMGRQEERIGELKKYMEDYRKEPTSFGEKVLHTNLLPMANWIDFLNDGKTNMAKMWQASTLYRTPEQKAQAAFKMEQAIADAEDKLSKNKLAALKAAMDQKNASSSLSFMNALMRQKTADKKFTADIEKDINSQMWEKIDEKGKFSETLENLKLIGGNLRPMYKIDPATKKPALYMSRSALDQLLTNVAKTVGKDAANIAVAEATRYKSINWYDWKSRFIGFFSKNPDVPVPAEYADTLRRIVTKAAEAKLYVKSKELKKLNSSFSQSPTISGDPLLSKYAQDRVAAHKEFINDAGKFDFFEPTEDWMTSPDVQDAQAMENYNKLRKELKDNLGISAGAGATSPRQEELWKKYDADPDSLTNQEIDELLGN